MEGAHVERLGRDFLILSPLKWGAQMLSNDVVLYVMYGLYGHLCPSKARWWM